MRGPLRSLTRHEVAEAVRRSPALVAKVLPIDPEADPLVVASASETVETGPDGLALPPPELFELDDYVASGERHFDTLTDILTRAGYGPERWGDVLDFGCGSARLTRHFVGHAREHEVWGVDINAASIAWCEGHLSPPLRFAPCSTYPHLPFADDSFGLVIAGSVFTHISELSTTWLLELRRITRPGGHLYLTVQDQACIEALDDDDLMPPGHWMAAMADRHRSLLDRLGRDVSYVSIDRSNKDAMVFHDRAYLLETWGRVLEVVDVVDRAYNVQTAVVLRKPGP